MALKGHTRIELTNVETGEVEVHEDNNMVTNALSKLLGNYGCFCNNPLSGIVNDTPASTVRKLTGGLMLFDKEIEGNPEIINAPAGTSVVGCGSLIAYNGTNTMAGSYNETESGWTEEGGYKHVWDFTTSQANGNIACACLTTNAGGKITEGTFPYSSDYVLASENMFTNGDITQTMNFYNTAKTANYIMFADGINNRIIVPATMEEVAYGYHTGTSTTAYENFKKTIFYKKSIDLDLYRFGFSNISIFDGNKNNNLSELETNNMYLGRVTVEMPEGLKNVLTQELLDTSRNYYNVSHICDDNNIYLLIRYRLNNTTGSLQKNDILHIWQINATTFESNYYSITNISDEIYFYGNINTNFSFTNYCRACNDYIAFVGYTTKKIYLVNKNTNETITLTTPDGEEYASNSASINTGCSFNNKILFDTSVSNNQRIGVIDLDTKKITFKNIKYFTSFTGASGGSNPSYYMKLKGVHYGIGISSDNNLLKLWLDPTLLITINNLETPVQKTSAQTMKVTYVLTQE
jgi:hypothetical protein